MECLSKQKGCLYMKNNAKSKATSIKRVIAAMAEKATSANANSTCLFVAHQPKLPETAKKLRKF